ncbi:MAG: 30S ribosomal protein S8 [Oligoflexia bacterium]|nr:30S ribosomal protein S8 [Oligoflexia bacterium]
MSNDLVADLLTRIRNAQRAGHRSVSVRPSKLVINVLEVLRSEGFIQSFERKQDATTKFPIVDVTLKYYSSGEPAIGTAKRASKSGRRVYSKVKGLPKVFNGLGISILTTSHGVMSDREARKKKLGGEILAFIG